MSAWFPVRTSARSTPLAGTCNRHRDTSEQRACAKFAATLLKQSARADKQASLLHPPSRGFLHVDTPSFRGEACALRLRREIVCADISANLGCYSTVACPEWLSRHPGRTEATAHVNWCGVALCIQHLREYRTAEATLPELNVVGLTALETRLRFPTA